MRRYLVPMLRSEERDTSRVSHLFARTAENSSSPAKYGYTICYSENVSLLYLEMCRRDDFSFHNTSRWPVNRNKVDCLWVCRLQRLQASMIIYPTREKHVSGVFIEVVSWVLQSRDKLSHVIKCWTSRHVCCWKFLLGTEEVHSSILTIKLTKIYTERLSKSYGR